MAKKIDKSKKKAKKRLFFLGIICLAVNFAVFYSLGNVWKQIYEKNKESKDLTLELTQLKEKEEELKVEVNKLNNPDYVAKYAREKFLYSGKNEYIIKIK